MPHDIIDLQHELKIRNFLKLDLNATNDEGVEVHFINPSASKNFIYFRTISGTNMWKSGICMFDRRDNKFNVVENKYNLEDLRLFDNGNRVGFVAAARKPTTHMFETRIGYFNDDCSQIECIIDHITSDGAHIKNITPLVDLDSQKVWFIDVLTREVYELAGTRVCKCAELKADALDQRMAAYSNARFGTTQYIHVKDTTYGSLIHITKKLGSRVYYVYLWIEIDIRDWTIIFVSQPFVVHFLGLVFVSHIEKLANGEIQLMLGMNDDHTCRCVTTLDDLRMK